MKRNVLDKDGTVIGSMDFPDDTPESVVQAKLEDYRKAITIDSRFQTKFTIQQRKAFAEQMLEDFKAKNIEDGINAMQALWMHHRMRELPIVIGGVSMKQDLMNMSVSGDIETACIALQYAVPDDMSMPYHWLSSARLNWLINKMKVYLGWA